LKSVSSVDTWGVAIPSLSFESLHALLLATYERTGRAFGIRIVLAKN
jgi:hypothetical protein